MRSEPDRILLQQIVVLVDFARKRVDELADDLLPAARRFQRHAADADVAGHHALAGEHFEECAGCLRARGSSRRRRVIAPMSMACVPSQTRWLFSRDNSVIMTRSHCALRGNLDVADQLLDGQRIQRLFERFAR